MSSQQTTTQAGTISERLRAETAGQHKAIENARRFNRLGSEDYTKDEYIGILERFYGFYAPLEEKFRKHEDIMQALDYGQRFKLPLLKEDLTALGHTEDSLSDLPLCDALPPTGTPAQAIGAIYVMEGSTHGAQYIAKRLRQQLGLGGTGLKFYEGYGAETMPRWQAFKSYLDSAFDPARDGDAVVTSATRTFEALHEWMDE